MPSAIASDRARPSHDDLDNYDVDDFSDDVFRSPTPPDSSKKRKLAQDNVAIDEQVSVQKRARVPNVKLDEDRLLSAAGIPTLRTRAQDLKIKGKGHEFSDAARLLSFYQLWLDDLFPKARFLDALAMVEKAGHKKKLIAARNEWIHDSAKRNRDGAVDEEGAMESTELCEQPGDASRGQPPTTPPANPVSDDIPDDEDLYSATPRVSRPAARAEAHDDMPGEDDLAGLIAEAETHDRAEPARPAAPRIGAESEENDLEALMAEAEAQDGGSAAPDKEESTAVGTGDDFADDEAAMREMDGLW